MLLSFEIPDEPIIAAARLAHHRRVRVLVNPAPSRPLSRELVVLSPILTPNAREALALDRRVTHCREPLHNGEVRDAARHLSTLTGARVVVTLGAHGALAVVDGEAVHQSAIAVASRDTTGAGDAFSGVLAARLAAAEPFLKAVQLATATASLSVASTRARTALPARHEVEVALASLPGASR